MCFICRKRDMHIASEPVNCLKLMRLVFIDGEYRLNSQFYPSTKGYAIGDEILPTYLDDHTFNEWMDSRPTKEYVLVLNGEAVHSFKCDSPIDKDWVVAKDLTDFITTCPDAITVLCEIPKGAVYFDNNLEYASRKLVIKGVVCSRLCDNIADDDKND